MSKQLKIIIGVLVSCVILTYIILQVYQMDRPKATPDSSFSRAIQLESDTVTVDLTACTPDLRRIDTFSQSTIIEVAGREFDVCLINYGPALHDRNLNQKLPTRCAVPVEREKISFPILKKGVDLTSLTEFCQ
ncbi:hypothetical protein KBD81_01210 [Candidatus Woesebacteria bacterium]|nr:hypothetical protein [Candidatus Woesebacteria bacterium]